MTTAPKRRPTRQQATIAALLEQSPEFVSAQALHARLREEGETIGLATVYRTLQSMVEAGTADTLRHDDGESVYRSCSSHHHHHLVCRACGHTVEVEGPEVERWTDRVATANGFSDVSHSLDIFGICADCRAKR